MVSPVVVNALKRIWDTCNVGTLHVLDEERIVALFDILLRKGVDIDEDELRAYLEADEQWSRVPNASEFIVRTVQILKLKKATEQKHCWSEDIFEIVQGNG